MKLSRMSDPTNPNVYGIPLGCDLAEAFVGGFGQFCEGLTPIQVAKAEVYVNTSRMQRRLRDAFDAGSPTLLPKIRLLTDLGDAVTDPRAPKATPPLRQKLEISRLVSAMLDAQPDLAPKSSLFPLSESLLRLLDEMVEEDISLQALAELNVSDLSGHWARSLEFLQIVGQLAKDENGTAFRQKAAVAQITQRWAQEPPDHPIVILGSTGSRKTTRQLMTAVAALPLGAVLLPGFDWSTPDENWSDLGSVGDKKNPTQEDHPQFRFWKFFEDLGADPKEVKIWPGTSKATTTRDKLISLSLRPAPVTDAWLVEGPELTNLAQATETLTLIEANSPKVEAEAIALRMRYALQEKKTVALISPDRVLTRQVAAALDRWDLVADDSAGVPLSVTPPGRLMSHILDLFQEDLTAEKLLVILKHPIVHTGHGDRGQHLLRTRELELWLRASGTVLINANFVRSFAEVRSKADSGIITWAEWVCRAVFAGPQNEHRLATDWLERHIALAELLSDGPEPEQQSELWQEAAGRAVESAVQELTDCGPAAGEISNRDYSNLFRGYLASETVRNQDGGRPDLLILGTLESRVQSADLVILGGLNDGVWPPAPSPDPWLNRQMRQDAGLLSPDRQIGLSAHDYQQAISNKEVCITRSLRTADADTVASRWLNRLTNLLEGLPSNGGQAALSEMRARGRVWSEAAAAQLSVTEKLAPAPRPSPQPPTSHRPKKLSVTKIKTLIRDPYAIYAERLLKLRPLNALSVRQEYQLRGILFHKILQEFIEADRTSDSAAQMQEIAERVLEEECPWPSIRMQWSVRLQSIIPAFLAQEKLRQTNATRIFTETKATLRSVNPEFTLVGVADRIDQAPDGTVTIYDYKTGAVPTKPQQLHFDKQLLLEAAMQEQGAFEGIAASPVNKAQFLGINSKMSIVDAPLEEVSTEKVWQDFQKLITNWMQPDRGYSARIALFSKSDFSPYDHLSRFGEWGLNNEAIGEVVE